MTEASFNLISEPWIPCVHMDGRIEELGLADALAQASALKEIRDNSPLVTVSIYRLLLAILHRNFGPRNVGAWMKLWGAGCFETGLLDEYWKRWRNRFDLYDKEFPFYQVASLRTKARSSIARLALDCASGNNATLFDHSSDEIKHTVPHSEAARLLIAIQSYALTGRLESGYPKAGSLADKAVLMVRGKNLWETLMFNLIWDRPRSDEEDIPCWERKTPTEFRERRFDGYLDYLTWQSRRVKFLPPASTDDGPSEVFFDAGYSCPKDSDLYTDPQVAYRRTDEGFEAFRLKEDRALWRDSSALLGIRDHDKTPEAFNAVAQLTSKGILPPNRHLNIMVIGLATYQAKVFLWRHEQLPLPLSYLNNRSLIGHLAGVLDDAETVATKLYSALRVLAENMLVPLSDAERKLDKNVVTSLVKSFPSIAQYWASLEVPFLETYEGLPDDPERAIDSWKATLCVAAGGALKLACEGLDGSARSMKAATKAQRYLNAVLSKLKPRTEGGENNAEE